MHPRCSFHVFVLRPRIQVKVFTGKGQVKLGADIEVTAGPVGRDVGAALRGSSIILFSLSLTLPC